MRNALYMATLASIQWNDILGSYYRKKRAEGNPHNWSMIPTMRKLLSLLNRIAQDPAFVPKAEPDSTNPLPCYLFPTLTRKGYPSVCLDKPLKFSRENLQLLTLKSHTKMRRNRL